MHSRVSGYSTWEQPSHLIGTRIMREATALALKRRRFFNGGGGPAAWWRGEVKRRVHDAMEALHLALTETISADPYIVG